MAQRMKTMLRHHHHHREIINFVPMMRSGLSFIFTLLVALMPVLCGAQQGVVTVIIDPVFNGQPLVLGEQPYVNSHGDTLTVDLLRFYMTNVKLISVRGSYADPAAHLVDAEKPASCKFQVRYVDAADYVAIQFTLGVDSITNTNGANGGDLDPAKGMYWAWNTGYVMAKLEGHSNVCRTLHHAFEFHIGGYMPPYNAARTVRLEFPSMSPVRDELHKTIHINADVATWFEGISLAQTNSIMIPGKDACSIADKYTQMFEVTSVK